jgi:hypothetical protein
VEYRNKDADHVEWAKALKELYMPGLRDFVKKHYPLGPSWGPVGGAPVSQPRLLLQLLKHQGLRLPLHLLYLRHPFLPQRNLLNLHSLKKECQLSFRRLVQAKL